MRGPDVYRLLLRCYPAEFRHEYGGEMVGAFCEQLREARRTAGRLAAAAVWAGALFDLFPTALQEHRHVIQQDLRHAVRIFAANPGFTLVAILSLALGIGANSAIAMILRETGWLLVVGMIAGAGVSVAAIRLIRRLGAPDVQEIVDHATIPSS